MQKMLVSTSPYLKEGAQIILWFFLVAALVIFGLHAILSDAHPYPLDYGEAPLINQAMQLAAGENIYRPSLESPPFTIANYPPLYVISLLPFVNGSLNPFQMGRVISTLAALTAAAFLGLTTFHLHRNRLAAITTSVLFLSFPYVVEWSARARVDCLALAFAAAGLYVFARWPETKGGIFGGGLLLVAAVYTRQSYVLAAPLAAFIWLGYHNKRRALQLALLVGGASGLLFLMLNILTQGGFFYNIVIANVNEFGLERLQHHLIKLWNDAAIILVLGAIFLLAAWKSAKGWALLAPFLLGASISALTIGKIGSNVNYFLELAAALSLVGGALIAWNAKHKWRYALVVILIALQIGMLMESTMSSQVDRTLAFRRADMTALQRLEQMVQDMEGPIPADEYMGLLTLDGRPLYIQPFEVSQLARDGKWNQKPFLEDIANQRFESILIHHFGPWPVHKERWTPEMLATIQAAYRPAKTMAGTVIFLPQKEGEISRVPTPTLNSSIVSPLPDLQPVQIVSEASHWGQVDIAASPINPREVAVVATSSSQFNCLRGTCKVELWLFTSQDGGQSWEKVQPFTNPKPTFHTGGVDFDADGGLHILGIREDMIVYNHTREGGGSPISAADALDVTRAQVGAQPWMRIHPEDGQVFITLDAQAEDMLYVTPSLIRSQRYGPTWSTTSRADLWVAVKDIQTGRANPINDIQVLFGEGQTVFLVWTWGWEPLTWPRTVWMARSTDGGQSFGEPAPILETWGPINTASAAGRFAIAYRMGTEESQQLTVAVSVDEGRSWTSSIASGEVPLFFDPEHRPGIAISPEGLIDLVFLAHDSDSLDCVLDLVSWQSTTQQGRLDPCTYNVYYTYSPKGVSFSQPVRLNSQPIQGESLARIEGRSVMGSHLAIDSTNDEVYAAWIGTPLDETTQVYMIRIIR